jgi:hypothetical protein
MNNNAFFKELRDCRIIESLSDRGYAIVPVEPTEEMIKAFLKQWHETFLLGRGSQGDATISGYKAMIEAGRVK